MKFNHKVLLKFVAGTDTHIYIRLAGVQIVFFFGRMDGHFRVLQYILDVTHHGFFDIANSGQKNVPTPMEQFLRGHTVVTNISSGQY